MSSSLSVRLAVVAAVVMAATAAAPVPASAGSFDRLFVFGDSLSDSGNLADLIFELSAGTEIVPPPPYYQGRFSDGPVGADVLAARLGIVPQLTPSRQGGTNYAYAFAQTGAGVAFLPGTAVPVPNVGTQIGAFALDLATLGPIDGSDLFLLWAGANDYYFNGITDPNVVVGNLVQHITDLAALGATRFLVPNLPPLGIVPKVTDPTLRAQLNGLTVLHNLALASALGQLQATRPDLAIVGVDVFGPLVSGGGPGQFGFTNVTDAAFVGSLQGGGTVQPDYDGTNYFFWDDSHPTGRAHALIGTLFAASVVPEPSSLAMIGLGLAGAVGGAVRSRRRARAA